MNVFITFKAMKKYTLLFIALFIVSCSSDEAITKECLVCNSLEGNENIDVTSEEIKDFCVGIVGKDPDTGETVTITRELIDSYVKIFNAFGGDCKVQ